MTLWTLSKPLVYALDAERAHRLAVWALKHGLVKARKVEARVTLATDVLGFHFPHPIGLAAGFDKNAEAMDGLARLGFSFLEIGSVTPRPQSGNEKPRLFRLTRDKAVINRMGFNNVGAVEVARRLAQWRQKPGHPPLGVNLGKNKETQDAAADYETGVRTLGRFADYLVVNVSSPNTPGLRALQEKRELDALAARVRAAMGEVGIAVPLLLKVAPDLTDEDLADIAEVAMARFDGLIVSNTTLARPPKLKSRLRGQSGGLSGRPLFDPSTRVLGQFYRLTQGRLPLIGVGGVENAKTAYAKIKAGASLVQLYSALVYRGPGLVAKIVEDLAVLLANDGYAHLADAVGADHRRKS